MKIRMVTVVGLLIGVGMNLNVVTKPVWAVDYYVATNGSDSNSGSSQSPWATFAHAIGELGLGDRLNIYNGTYRQAMKVVNKQGRVDARIVIRAINDGQVVVDGENQRLTLWIERSSYIDVEGIYFRKCSNPNIVGGQCSPVTIKGVSGVAGSGSHDVRLRRVSARDGKGLWNPVFKIEGGGRDTNNQLIYTHDILIEDGAAYGEGIHGLLVDWDTYDVTVRRFFNLWEKFSNPDKYAWCQNIEVYGGYNTVIENAIGFNGSAEALPCHGKDSSGNAYSAPVHGIIIPGQNQKVLGSVIKEGKGNSYYFTSCSGCRMENIVAINATNAESAPRGVSSNKSSNNQVRNFTWISNAAAARGVVLAEGNSGALEVRDAYFGGLDSGYAFYKESGVSGLLTHSQNRFTPVMTHPYFNTSSGSNESSLTVNWPVGKYGYGAYLMASRTELAGKGENGGDVGADVIYRYEDGVLTTQPLWPWPMEDRIMAERGISVTWQSSGGLWKTLDGVYGGTIPTPTPGSASPTPTLSPTPTPTPDIEVVIVDNADAGFRTTSGPDAWQEYVDPQGLHYGGSHLFNHLIGDGDTATWSFSVSKPGMYDVYASWWPLAKRPADVPYTINFAGGTDELRMNQQVTDGQWNLLGRHYFMNQGSVVVSDMASSGEDVVADAVRLVYQGPGWEYLLSSWFGVTGDGNGDGKVNSWDWTVRVNGQ